MASQLLTISFLELLEKSELLPPAQFNAAVRKFKLQEMPSGFEAAKTLVLNGVLSRFQADRLMQGRYRGFFIGNFKVLEILGVGGMGWVYTAEDLQSGRIVALKVLSEHHQHIADMQARMKLEVRAGQKLDHPNIVRIFAVGKHKAFNFVALDFIDGQTAYAWIKKLGQLDVGDALLITIKSAEALQHAHERNLIHRDIKPDNILITKHGEIKVADFGLAKVLDEDMSMTRTGFGLGTPLYSAPEQARNAKYVDHRSDIYALGCSLYQMVTGQLPFAGDTIEGVISAKESGKFTPARKLNPKVSERLSLIIDKMMAQSIDHRYSDYEELLRDLEGLNQHNRSLSFCETPANTPIAAIKSRSGKKYKPASVNLPTPPAQKATVAPTPTTKPAPQQANETWFVRHSNAKGRLVINQMSTTVIRKAIAGNTLDLKAKAKKNADDPFLPISQFAEFSKVTARRLTRDKAEAKTVSMKEQFAQIELEHSRRHRWRWLKRMTEGTFGLFGFVFYMVILAAIGYGLYLGAPIAYEYISQWLESSS